MNRHHEAAQAIAALPYPADALEGVTVLLEAQVEATLALAHAQHTANLIAYLASANREKVAYPVPLEVQKSLQAQIDVRLGLA